MDFRKQMLKNTYQDSTSLDRAFKRSTGIISLCHTVNMVVTSLVY